eukprot:Em0015g1026a
MDHKHCESCVSLGCTRHNGCPVLQCKNLCGFSMHECKTKEHASELCPRSLVPCVNAVYGCELTMERRKLADHVQHCPASVLVCNIPAPPLNQCSRTDGDGDLIADISPSERLASVTRRRCQLLCRRDERSGHIQTYHLAERRCKQKELAMYGYTVPEVTDSFGQLPTEMLVKICGFLDSLGLRSLSQTSYYLKEVCNKLVTKKGITVSVWQRQGSLWVQGPKVWTFTKVSSPVRSWLYTDGASMSAHMMSCDCLKSVAVKYHSTEVWDTKEMKTVPQHQADFSREKNAALQK